MLTLKERIEGGLYGLLIGDALGRDKDTTACIAGGIAGIRDGIEAIPQRWRENLRGQELFQPLLEKLLNR